MVQSTAKKGDHQNYIIRFIAADDKVRPPNHPPTYPFVQTSIHPHSVSHSSIYPPTHPPKQTLLSSMLHREADGYDEDSLEWWAKLKETFGESQQIQ